MTKHMTGTRNEWLSSAARAARGGEGTHAAEATSWRGGGRSCPGPSRQGVSVRDRRGDRFAGQPLQRALATPRLSLDVRARLPGRLLVCRRSRTASTAPSFTWRIRRHALRGVAGSPRETAGVQAADGVEFPLGLVVRQRLQLRLRGGIHREQQQSGSSIQLPHHGRAAVAGAGEVRWSRSRRIWHRRGEDTGEAPGVSAFVLEDGVVYHTYSAYTRGLDGLWGCTSGLTARPGAATRPWCKEAVTSEPASGTAATTSTTARREDKSAWLLNEFPSRRFSVSQRCSSLPARR